MNRRNFLFGVPAATMAVIVGAPEILKATERKIFYADVGEMPYPEMAFNVEKLSVHPKSRALNAQWSSTLDELEYNTKPISNQIVDKQIEEMIESVIYDNKWISREYIDRYILQREKDQEVYNAVISGDGRRLLEIGGVLGGPKSETSVS